MCLLSLLDVELVGFQACVVEFLAGVGSLDHHVLTFQFSMAPILCLPLVHRLRLVERQQKEQAYGHMNAVKIHNQWRRIMRMAKTEELKQDIEILSQSYDRTVDRKDALIQVHRQLQLHTTSIYTYLAHRNA